MAWGPEAFKILRIDQKTKDLKCDLSLFVQDNRMQQWHGKETERKRERGRKEEKETNERKKEEGRRGNKRRRGIKREEGKGDFHLHHTLEMCFSLLF